MPDDRYTILGEDCVHFQGIYSNFLPVIINRWPGRYFVGLIGRRQTIAYANACGPKSVNILDLQLLLGKRQLSQREFSVLNPIPPRWA